MSKLRLENQKTILISGPLRQTLITSDNSMSMNVKQTIESCGQVFKSLINIQNTVCIAVYSVSVTK